MTMFNSTGGQNGWWTDSTGWGSGDACGWAGVNCTATDVTALSLEDNGLEGNLPADLWTNLPNLQFAHLGRNKLCGRSPQGRAGLFVDYEGAGGSPGTNNRGLDTCTSCDRSGANVQFCVECIAGVEYDPTAFCTKCKDPANAEINDCKFPAVDEEPGTPLVSILIASITIIVCAVFIVIIVQRPDPSQVAFAVPSAEDGGKAEATAEGAAPAAEDKAEDK